MSVSPDPRLGLPSASVLPRLKPCGASWRLSQQAKKQGTSDQTRSFSSDSGHKIHRWLETHTDADWDALSDDEKETATKCDKQAEEILAQWGAEPGYIVTREKRLWLYDDGAVVSLRSLGNPIFSGAGDLIVHGSDRACIIDFKSGRGDYEPAHGNAQLSGLAVLVAGWTGVRKVRVALVQPWAGPPSIADFDGAALDQAKAQLLDLLDHVQRPDLTPIPGDWCHYCPARIICPSLTSEFLMLLDPSLIDDAAKGMIVKTALNLDAERLGAYLHAARRVQWMIDALREEARRRIEEEDPGAPHGWTLREGARMREVTDAIALFDLLKEPPTSVTPEEMSAACKVSLPVLEASVAKRTGMPKTRACATIADIGSEYIVHGRKAPSLVEDKPKLT